MRLAILPIDLRTRFRRVDREVSPIFVPLSERMPVSRVNLPSCCGSSCSSLSCDIHSIRYKVMAD